MVDDKISSEQAAAELWRLAQAHAVLRTWRSGTVPTGQDGKIEPTRADIEAVERENPELVRLARKQ